MLGRRPPITILVYKDGQLIATHAVGTNPPTVSIVTPAANQQSTDPVFTVFGTADDDTWVSQVYCRANDNPWELAEGTMLWNHTLSLAAGTNVIQAYAVDYDGYTSATNSVKLVAVLKTALTVNTNGAGSISPNYNGQLLEIGKTYTVTATAKAGSVFGNWTGSLTTNKAALTFLMASNLNFTANFVDVTKPVLSITAPVANQRWSNAFFTVSGKVTDNLGVSQVYCQVNGGGWVLADGTTAWTKQMGLIPGTNTVQAYAVDGTGNTSLTNTVKFVYVLTTPLTVSTNGAGSISPNYNGQLLEIGRTYTMTAAPKSGWAFGNWTGSLTTNKAALTFTMASNLNFTATFVDTAKPALSITAPTANQRWSNSVITVAGKASDNQAVTQVYCQLNGGGWMLADGTVNWTNLVTLVPGTNVISAYAVDAAGNTSPTGNVKFVYVLTTLLTISTNGAGTISPNYYNTPLEIGKTYTMTATARAGSAFVNWTGSVSNNKPALTFQMASNLSFSANFIDVAKPVVTITSPVANQHWSNAFIYVTGKSTDNLGVAGVYCQVNGGGWTLADGTSPWTNLVSLLPGTNTISAYAVDVSGNFSATNTLKFIYVVSDRLLVAINGQGTVTPNYNGQYLEIGKTYSMTAAPKAGWIFTNWSGHLDTNKATVTFQMASNINFNANFADIARPTITITAPVANQRWSNDVFNVTGKATDNDSLSHVYCRLNNGEWVPADGLNLWSFAASLVPGTNTISAFSEDLTGNRSPTNSVSFVYVLSAPLTVAINGQGTVTPNYNGQLLEIGKTYKITAAAQAGFGFVNWTGSSTTNAPALTFQMASNLNFTANFGDTTKPALSITAPVANQRWSNSTFTVTGKASDNFAVATVYCQLNGGVWTPASGTTNWAADATLAPGTNTISAYAVDTAGNLSSTNSLRFVYVVSAKLTVNISGQPGYVSPDYNGKLLEVGRAYTITAYPASNDYLFGGWTGSTNSRSSVLTFIMQSNLTFTASFGNNPFKSFQGEFQGLFYPTNGTDIVDATNSGYFTLFLNANGAYTGKLLTRGATLNLNGAFAPDSTSIVTASGAGTPSVQVNFKVNLATKQVSGTVTGDAWSAPLIGYASTNQTIRQGSYTLSILGQTNAAVSPAGHGGASVLVDPAGALTMAGSLADGSAISQSAGIVSGDMWPAYASLNGGKGILIGWISFVPDNALQRKSFVYWSKPPAPDDSYYPAGFAELRIAALNRYQAPPVNENAIGWKHGNMILSYGATNASLRSTNTFAVNNNAVRFYNYSIYGTTYLTNLLMSFTTSNGLFSGTISNVLTGQLVPMKGVIVQTVSNLTNYVITGSGWFLANHQGGRVDFMQQTNFSPEGWPPVDSASYLNGLVASVNESTTGYRYEVTFGSGTFINNPFYISEIRGGVGRYSYNPSAQTLSLIYSTPPSASTGTITENLGFSYSKPGQGTFNYTALIGGFNTYIQGTFVAREGPNPMPTSVAGKTINVIDDYNGNIILVFDSSGGFVEYARTFTAYGSYSYTRYSQYGGAIRLNYTNSGMSGNVNWLQIIMTTPYMGSYNSDYYVSGIWWSGSHGTFTVPFY